MNRSRLVWLVLLAIVVCNTPHELLASSDKDDAFFKGKSVRIIVSSGPGGFFDFMARIMAQFLPRYIPGNPTTIVQNMPGGGGNIAANYAYNVGKRDGLLLLVPTSGTPINPILSAEGIHYDPSKMHWLGSLSKAEYILLLRSDRYRTLEDVLQARETIYLGAQPGTGVFTTSVLLKEVLGLPIEIIRYKSGAEIDPALARGEVTGRMNTIGTLLTRNSDWLRERFVTVFLPIKEERHSAFPDVPTLYEIAPQHKELIDLANLQNTWTGAIATPPGVPANRIRLLRSAFDQMVRDPEFKKRLETWTPLLPTSGEELQKKIEALPHTPPKMRQLLRKVSGLD